MDVKFAIKNGALIEKDKQQLMLCSISETFETLNAGLEKSRLFLPISKENLKTKSLNSN